MTGVSSGFGSSSPANYSSAVPVSPAPSPKQARSETSRRVVLALLLLAPSLERCQTRPIAAAVQGAKGRSSSSSHNHSRQNSIPGRMQGRAWIDQATGVRISYTVGRTSGPYAEDRAALVNRPAATTSVPLTGPHLRENADLEATIRLSKIASRLPTRMP